MRIAISSLSGCGNTTVSRLVAHSLKLSFINYTFRNLAKDLELPFEKIQADSKTNPKYDYEVDRRQVALIGKTPNCVVGSRLAVWLDDDRLKSKIGVKCPPFDLKVWIYAPLNERAKRISKREKKTFARVLEDTLFRDEENEQRYLALYGLNVQHFPRAVDITVNTERFSAEQVAELIVSAAKKIQSLKRG
ncbi:MAG TPA: cytidylate kinase family protein [Candidatus Norongarragalinales archaeon]|nr:cytidylate kinase family protein [Candidatus Norongarragalinales archaeon]